MKILSAFFLAFFLNLFMAHAQAGTMQIDDFENLSIQSNAEISVIKSSKDQIVTNLTDEQLQSYRIESKNNTLIISYQGTDEPENAKMRVYTSSLNAIQVDGKAVVDVSDRFKFFNKLHISAKNGATVELNNNRVKFLYANHTSDARVNARKSKFTQLIIDGKIQES